MERFMVAVDGSDESGAALTWASRLAVTRGAEVLAVHSYELPYAEIPPSEHERLLTKRSDMLAGDWTRSAREIGATIRTEVIVGDPRLALVARSDEDPPDLLVLGRSGQGGGPGFLHLGSVVEHLAHHARCPLAVIPADGGRAIRRIVLGVDGSVPATAAVEWCTAFFGATRPDVLAVAVREPVAEWTPAWDEQNWRRSTERDVAKWAVPLTRAGLAVEPFATANLHPADGLLGVASERDADLLVIGTRGAGGFSGLRFGGVAIKVLHRATLPLVLIPPPED